MEKYVMNKYMENYKQARGTFMNETGWGKKEAHEFALKAMEIENFVNNDVKLRKRLDTLQHQIDVLQKELLDLSKLGCAK